MRPIRKLSPTYAAVAACCCSLAGPRLAAAEIKPVSVDGPRLKLADLVPTARGATDLDLGAAPTAGTTRIVALTSVLAHAPELRRLEGLPEAWRVETRAQALDCERLRGLVNEALMPQLRPGLEIASIDCRRPLSLPHGAIAAEMTLPEGQRLAGRFALPLRLRVGDWPALSSIVSLELGGAVDVVVAAAPVRMGEAIRAEALRVERRPASALSADVFGAPDELDGQEARLAIQPGTVLRRVHVRPVPLVRRGDRVRLMLRTAGLRLSTTALVREDGGLGDTITVLCPGTQRLLEVKVVGSESVEVLL